MKKTSLIILINLSFFAGSAVMANEIDSRQQAYKALGASDFSADRGDTLWHKNFPDPKDSSKQRNCGTCHTDNLKNKGKHARTGKVIDPLSPSTNAERFTDPKFIEKWFKRNCKWVVGRECTPQEKGDVLEYLRDK
ncbi:MAG: DUF1924 domain-containing protein [Gammaproteobacteria bacterium]|nr:DUF1924 domain-containing protein [Gammaproteobacteria bacterium]